MEALHYYNGQYLKKNEISISPDDVGFTRGYGVFEFFRVQNNRPVFLADHMARLLWSSKALNLQLPRSIEELEQIVQDLIRRNNMPDSAIKVMVTGGVSPNGFSPGSPTLLIMQVPFQPMSSMLYEQGATLMTHEYQRDLPEVKSVEYAKALALESIWKQKGHIDVLYHLNGLVSEVSRSSVFLVKEGQVITNRTGVLAGVTQKNVISAMRENIPVSIRDIRLEELWSADEVFITSTTKRVLPIVGVDQKKIGNGVPGKITENIMQTFEEFIKQRLG